MLSSCSRRVQHFRASRRPGTASSVYGLASVASSAMASASAGDGNASDLFGHDGLELLLDGGRAGRRGRLGVDFAPENLLAAPARASVGHLVAQRFACALEDFLLGSPRLAAAMILALRFRTRLAACACSTVSCASAARPRARRCRDASRLRADRRAPRRRACWRILQAVTCLPQPAARPSAICFCPRRRLPASRAARRTSSCTTNRMKTKNASCAASAALKLMFISGVTLSWLRGFT